MDQPSARSSRLAEPQFCTGCSACRAVCPHDAIQMASDAEGFLRPEINHGRCVGCGLCERACPVLRPGSERLPKMVLAMRAKDEALRRCSSSGGVFSLLAYKTLSRGGVVFGAAFDPTEVKVRHMAVRTERELSLLRGSKYVQSDIGDAYCCVLSELRAEKEVLFSGTPCQVAGLKSFLSTVAPNTDCGRLLLVEVICHGAPSPMIFSKYLESIKKHHLARSGLSGGDAITDLSFRDKICGWNHFSMTICSRSGAIYSKKHGGDLFYRCFFKHLISRPSCSSCPFRQLRSGSDVVLGDYWRVGERFPQFDDNQGVSLVLEATGKGGRAVSQILQECDSADSDYEHAVRVNSLLVFSKKSNSRRSLFFWLAGKFPFDFAARIVLLPTVKEFSEKALACLVSLVPTWLRDSALARAVKSFLGQDRGPR